MVTPRGALKDLLPLQTDSSLLPLWKGSPASPWKSTLITLANTNSGFGLLAHRDEEPETEKAQSESWDQKCQVILVYILSLRLARTHDKTKSKYQDILIFRFKN